MVDREIVIPAAERPRLTEMMWDYIVEMRSVAQVVERFDAYPHLDLYWSEPDTRWPYWLRADDSDAGFALVMWKAREGWFDMAEFFVSRPYRHRGIGLHAARRIIGSHPGNWHISQREANKPAIAFWHRVLDGFVDYNETTTSTGAVRREQRFTVPS